MTEASEISSVGDRLLNLLSVLPLDTVDYVCAYGSGAVSQEGEELSGKMIDFIIASRESATFHEQNIRQNPKHYSLLRFLGHQKITELQRSYAARVYCNTRIQCQVYSNILTSSFTTS